MSLQPVLDAGGSDSEEEPDISMSSFMSGDPNFNRETSDSQSMTKALDTLRIYLSNYAQMKQYRPAMLIFLHCLLARKEAKWYKSLALVYFDWLVDDWKRAGFPPKVAKRSAFAIYSTFLNREGHLALEACMRTLDPSLGLGRPHLADSVKTLSELFARRPMDSHLDCITARFGETQALLAPALEALMNSVNSEVVTKRRDGFVSDILPGVDALRPDQSDERQQRFIDQSRSIMMAHLNFLAKAPFGGTLEAGCLATLMERLFQLRVRPELPVDMPLYNYQRQRGSLLKEAERQGTHLLRPVELDRILACAACGKLLCGPAPQAMRCKIGDCQVVCHRTCSEQVKPISCSTAAGRLGLKHSNEAKESSGSTAPAKAASANRLETSEVTDVPGAVTQPKSAVPLPAGATASQPQPPQTPLSTTPEIRIDAAGCRKSSIKDAPAPSEGTGSESGSLQVLSGDTSVDMEQSIDDAANISPSISAPEEDAAVSEHPDIAGVPADFHGYIEMLEISKRLAQLQHPASGTKEAERFKEYQLALHEVAFSSLSHLRALTVLHLLFEQPWPQTNLQVQQQLGLHFVPECIALYRSLLDCVKGGANETEYQATGQLTNFGTRLLVWYSNEANALEFQRLGLSFGFAKTITKRKTSSINEDDIILRLMCLRREDSQFNRFFALAEANPVMSKRRFMDLYSVNIQQTMRMVNLLDTAARKAKKAKDACDFAEKDAENLEKCVAMAKEVSDYCNSTGAKLKEISRQLVLSRSFENFWERANMDEVRRIRFKGQVSHLHTCQLHMTREVSMPGLEGCRLRLFVFTDFLLVISELEDARGVKYQLPKQLGPSLSVDTQQQEQVSAEKMNLIETNYTPVIPMDSIVHILASETRQRVPGSRAVDPGLLRIIVEQKIIGGGGRVKPLMLEFGMSQEKPLMAFSSGEVQQLAGEFVECVRNLAPRLSTRQLDRHSSLTSSAMDLSARPQALSLQHTEHRRVHSTAGVSISKPAAGALTALGTAAAHLGFDESEGESIDERDEKLLEPSASDDAPAQEAAATAPITSPGLGLPVTADYQDRMEALLKEQQAVLPHALGLKDCESCQDALALSKSDQLPSRSEKVLLAWRLMVETHRALMEILPAMNGNQQVDSLLQQLSSLARATAECIDRESPKISKVERRTRSGSNDFESKFRLSRVSEVSTDSQTQPPQDSLLVEKRAQIQLPMPIPPPRPSKPPSMTPSKDSETRQPCPPTGTASSTPKVETQQATTAGQQQKTDEDSSDSDSTDSSDSTGSSETETGSSSTEESDDEHPAMPPTGDSTA